MKLKHNNMKFEHYIFGILLAVELIMSFTFLGYVHIPPISITIAYIPIVVTACIFNPSASMVMGLVFGLGSMYKASALYVMPVDKLFSPFQSAFPIRSLVLSVGMRALFGLIIGYLFVIARKIKYKRCAKAVCAVIAPKLHELFVYSAMGVLFPEYGFSYKTTFDINVNDLLIAVVCLVAVILIDIIYNSSYVKYYKKAIDSRFAIQYSIPKVHISMCVVSVFVLGTAWMSTIYFADRAEYMLGAYGIQVTGEISQDILHLQVQFLAAMLSLSFILILIILMVYRYMKYREYIGEMDELTDIMGRRLFLNHCTKCQEERKAEEQETGWFLFIDVDWFKQINDTLGHAMGDKVLKQIAHILKETFIDYGIAGRIGGDEFAVIIEKEMSVDALSQKLEGFLKDVSGIIEERKISCSIGAYHFVFPMDVNELLKKTDRVLYKAKDNGRACFIIQDDVKLEDM